MTTDIGREPDTNSTSTKPVKISIDATRCKGCSFCVEFCPRKALIMSQEINSKGYTPAKVLKESNCVACGLCEIMCPEFAITVTCK